VENVTLTGIDLSKDVFEVRMENHTGRLVQRKKVNRAGLVKTVSSLPSGSTVAMEACGSSHYWGKEFEKRGLKVLLIPPQHVVPFRKSQKNDVNDAEAICEAARRPRMRFVSLKTDEQQDLQSLHRVRSRLMRDRTALMNQLRGLLLDRGYSVPRGVARLKEMVTRLLGELPESSSLRVLVGELWSEFCDTDARCSKFTKLIEKSATKNESCKKVMELQGVGPLTATAVVAHVGHPKDYKNGRAFSASLGMVPRQFSSGGKVVLGRITKTGDSYLRSLLVHGARSVVQAAVRRKKQDATSLWVRSLHSRAGANRTAVALGNKTARRIWAILAGKTEPLAV